MNVDQSKPGKPTRSSLDILRIFLAAIAALAAVMLLVVNITSFLDAVGYYLAMGYPSGEVYKQLIPSQLLPGIFEPLAIYGGLALLLVYVGRLKPNTDDFQALLTPSDSDDIVEESVSKPELIEEGTAEPDKFAEP